MTVQMTQAEQALAEETYAFCMEHMQEHFTIQALAARAGVSSTKLKQVYRAVYGAPLFAHIRREKMLWAARQLDATASRVIDIAASCGYDNPSKFSAAFRCVTGCTPKEYRERVRSE